jgi:hypothetical protein
VRYLHPESVNRPVAHLEEREVGAVDSGLRELGMLIRKPKSEVRFEPTDIEKIDGEASARFQGAIDILEHAKIVARSRKIAKATEPVDRRIKLFPKIQLSHVALDERKRAARVFRRRPGDLQVLRRDINPDNAHSTLRERDRMAAGAASDIQNVIPFGKL